MAYMKLHFIPFTVTESADSTAQTSLNLSDKCGQIVALQAGRTGRRTGLTILNRDSFVSCLASLLSGKEGLRWTINLPVWFPPDDLHPRLNGESQARLFSPGPPTVLQVSHQTQHRMLAEENAISVSSLCRPALRERTLRRLTESGGLQALIDQWDDSSLEELEAFIDSYFEMVWEQTMGSTDRPTAEQDAAAEEAGQEEVLSSIDRKLSKLELLEEIRRDVSELRSSLENSWRAIQELREKSRNDNNTC